MKRVFHIFLLLAMAAVSFTACEKSNITKDDDDPNGPPGGNVKIMMAASDDHSLILKADGTVWGCGYNTSNKLGLGKVSSVSKYTKIFDDAIFIAVSRIHSVIIKKDYTLWAAGGTYKYYELGKKFHDQNGGGWTKIADDVKYVSPVGSVSMIIKRDNSLWIVGTNYEGSLGMGLAEGTTLKEYTKIDDDVVECSLLGSTMYLKKDGTVYGAGWNTAGELGLGHRNVVNKFTKIRSGVKSIAATSFVATGLILDNPESSLIMAGEQRWGQLGIGYPRTGESMWMAGWSRYDEDDPGPPRPDENPKDWPDDICISPHYRHVRNNVKKVSLGYNHTMILTKDNNLYACGGWDLYDYSYALGADGKTHYYPVKVASNVVDVFASEAGTTILKEDGSMWAASNWNVLLTGDGRTTGGWVPYFEKIVLP